MIKSIRNVAFAVAAAVAITASPIPAYAAGGGSGSGAGAGAAMNYYYAEQAKKQNAAEHSIEVTGWIECPKAVTDGGNCIRHDKHMTWKKWLSLPKDKDLQYAVVLELN